MKRPKKGKRGERHLHLVAHSAHVEQNLVWTLVYQLAAERANHVERLSVRATGVSTQWLAIETARFPKPQLHALAGPYEYSYPVAFLLRERNPNWPDK